MDSTLSERPVFRPGIEQIRPGDTLEMRDNVLFRNGKRVDEPYIMITPDIPAVRSFGPVEVPMATTSSSATTATTRTTRAFRGSPPEGDIRGRMVFVLHVGECPEK